MKNIQGIYRLSSVYSLMSRLILKIRQNIASNHIFSPLFKSSMSVIFQIQILIILLPVVDMFEA
jgi:hypothetical protein